MALYRARHATTPAAPRAALSLAVLTPLCLTTLTSDVSAHQNVRSGVTFANGVPTYGGMLPHAALAAHTIAKATGVKVSGGKQSRPNNPSSDHPLGLAADFVTNRAGGDRVVRYALANWERLNVKYVIWRGEITSNAGKSWRPASGHFDHVHISFETKPSRSVTVAQRGGGEDEETAGPRRGTKVPKCFRTPKAAEKCLLDAEKRDIQQNRNAVIREARIHLGDNFKDCSDFTEHVFRAVKLRLPERAADQAKLGVRVSRHEARSGDLVVFKRPNGSAHVGILSPNPGRWFVSDSPGEGVREKRIPANPTMFRRVL